MQCIFLVMNFRMSTFSKEVGLSPRVLTKDYSCIPKKAGVRTQTTDARSHHLKYKDNTEIDGTVTQNNK